MIRRHLPSFFFGLLSGLTAAGFILLFISRPKRYPIQLLPPPTPSPLRIHVAGAVRQPGVYLLPRESIWQDALHAAGGGTADADLTRVNLAATLVDGQHIFFPYESPEGSEDPVIQPRIQNDATLIDINHATLLELEQLPGIGPSLALKIVEYREENGFFLSLEELLNVSGIGPAKLALIKDQIMIP